MVTKIIKRDGRSVPFELEKITEAIFKAAQAIGGSDVKAAENLAQKVKDCLDKEDSKTAPTVEHVQDTVEKILIENGHARTAKEFILYRAERTRVREMNTKLMKIYEDLTFKSALDNDIKRENANIDGDTAMGTMLKYGSEGAKQFYEMRILNPKHAKAHREGDIHIHDLDFLTLTTTCCQIDLIKLFENGFSTGHGYLREPNDIASYSALACIAIQSNQNDQHGGQSVPNFDFAMAKGVAKTYRRIYRQNLARAIELLTDAEIEAAIEQGKEICDAAEAASGAVPKLEDGEKYKAAELEILTEKYGKETAAKLQKFAFKHAEKETDRAVYQAMEALIHNLNTMHSRAGAQIPFSSLNYGSDTSPEGRMVIKNILLATDSGLGNGETPIFPIHIFKVKEGVSYNPQDPNYDLFKLAIKVSAKRLFPNFSFLDAPYNLKFYRPGHPETEVAYMGCRTRVIANRCGPETVYGRGNLSFTSVNLPRLAILANKNIDFFFDQLDRMCDLVIEQLLERFEIQCQKLVKNYPFLMGQGIWVDSDKLTPNDSVREVLRQGTLSCGFIGLAEALKALTGKHHGESEESQRLGLEIIGFMLKKMNQAGEKNELNFSLVATPAEGLSGRFVRMDKKKFGEIAGVTDKDYYTNSFHIPVYYKISAFDKIRLEAPYHALTNAGHISYIEMDGDPLQNLDAFEKVVRYMKECGIGYGSINHPVDRDPVCGHTGIIGDYCPHCGRKEEQKSAKGFERIRRITGYLVGTEKRFNDAKKAEVKDRLKHDTSKVEEIAAQ
ncbi:MAG: anaerobic ribonucleoside triphosphate reductase [Oscillospiraceae bacterium]|jgi:ribonucleoside-triphosphate reductase|nr:anaerobic ribonucleoside triphosphate reductase [Oscillospiraceae bacterium]